MHKRNQDENCHSQDAFNRKMSLMTSKLNIELRKEMFGDLDNKKIRAEVFGGLRNVNSMELINNNLSSNKKLYNV